MAENGWKWLDMAGMAGKGLKWLGMVDIARNYWNSWKWLKKVYLEMARNG